MERHLISAAVSSRDAFDSLISRDIEPELSPPGQIVFQALHTYYGNDASAKAAKIDLLCEWIKKSYPKHVDTLVAVMKDLPDTSSENVVALWLRHKQEFISNRLQVALKNQSKDDIKDLMDKWEFYQKYADHEQPKTYQGVPVAELLAVEQEEGRMPLAPKVINDALRGGLKRGKHIAVVARPEYGKSQFCINEAAVLVQQGYKVLYCTNEEGVESTLLRLTSRLCDVDSYAIEDGKKTGKAAEYTALAKQRGYDNCIAHEMYPGTVGEITKLIEKHRPDAVFIDQLRNIHMKNATSLTDVLERGGRAMRNLALRYKIRLFSVTQAGDDAHNKPKIDYNDVEYSNTGFAATVDVFVGIGSDEELRRQGTSIITLSRNKISGVQESYAVQVDKLRSKIRSA